MLDSRWRFYIGPLVTAAVGAAILLTDRFVVPVLSPAPGALMLFATLFAAYVGGLHSGLISALLAIAVVAITLSEPGLLVTVHMDRLVRLIAYSVMLVGAATLLGYSQTRARRALEQMTAANASLEAARLALDQADYGVILLDADLRAQFISRAMFAHGKLRAYTPNDRPTYADILQEAAANLGFLPGSEELNKLIASRVAYVRAGNTTPLVIPMADGSLARFRCFPLPDGWRLLTYMDVTDVTRQHSELQALHAALDRIEEGVVLLDRDLRTHFMNRAIREIGGLRERAPGERPTFAELLDEVRVNTAYAIPADQVDAYVAQRVEYVRSGNPNPVDLRMADGKVLRFKCNVLPDGGRMLIYANVTDLVRNAEQLEKLATTDGMTGLHNRRQFMKLADAEWSRFQRYGRPLSLLMLDVDLFKSINDRFGHDVGDQVVAHIAALCREDRRISDVVARIGGEEFALLLPETTIDAAYTLAERLRRNVELSPLLSNSNGLAVTVSIGVAEAGPGMSSIVDLMKDSDRALYEAKRIGRNRVVRAEALSIGTMLDAEAPLQSA
jgi:diguanylate cyclase (GGDEF)-like protein